MISIRITDEEYRSLKRLCDSEGARSVSELARAAMDEMLNLNRASPSEGLETRIQELHGRLSELDLKLETLAQRLDRRASAGN